MEEIVQMLSKELEYIAHEISGETIVMFVASRKNASECPNYGQVSDKLHSRYTHKLQDLPIQGRKVKLHI